MILVIRRIAIVLPLFTLFMMEKNGLILRESVTSDARLKSLIPTEKAKPLAQVATLALSSGTSAVLAAYSSDVIVW